MLTFMQKLSISIIGSSFYEKIFEIIINIYSGRLALDPCDNWLFGDDSRRTTCVGFRFMSEKRVRRSV